MHNIINYKPTRIKILKHISFSLSYQNSIKTDKGGFS